MQTVIIDFKLSNEEHEKRNFEKQTESLKIDLIIDFFQDNLKELMQDYINTTFDTTFDTIKQYMDLLDKLYMLKQQNYNNNVIVFYDYNYERFVIEKQQDL